MSVSNDRIVILQDDGILIFKKRYRVDRHAETVLIMVRHVFASGSSAKALFFRDPLTTGSIPGMASLRLLAVGIKDVIEVRYVLRMMTPLTGNNARSASRKQGH